VACSPMALWCLQDRANGRRTATVACFDALDRDRDFSAENFYTISTDTHIDDMVILSLVRLCGANKNVAGRCISRPCSIRPARRWRQLRAQPSRPRSIPRRNLWPDRLRCRRSCGRGDGLSDRQFRGKQSTGTFPPLRARYSAARSRSSRSLCAVSSEARATMVKGMPVETVWIGAESSKSVALRFVRAAMSATS